MYPADRDLTPTSFESITSGQPVSREPRPSRLRRVGRACAWIGLVAITALCAALVFVHTPWGKELARSRIEAALAKKVNGSVSLGDVDYGFLFSDVELRDLQIADAAGAPAISIARLAVDLDRGSLVHGAPVLDRVAVRGLEVAIRKHADGTSNLTGLFVAGERKPRHIRVGLLDVAGASLSVTRVDGSVIAIDDLAIAGSIDANGLERAYGIELGSVAADLTVAENKTLALGLEGLTANIELAGDRSIDLVFRELAVGPLSIDRVEARAGLEGGALSGEQLVELAGLRIAAGELAALLGRPVLGGDVTADLSIAGPPGVLDISGSVVTSGGTLAITGAVDARDLEAPAYSLEVGGHDLATRKLLEPGRAHSIDSEVAIHASGAGIPGRPGSRSRLSVAAGKTGIVLGDRALELGELTVEARSAGRAVALETLKVRVAGLEIAAAGALSAERAIDARVAITAEPARLVDVLAGLGIDAAPIAAVGPVTLQATAGGRLDETLRVALAPAAFQIAGGRATIRGGARLERRALAAADLTVDLDGIDIVKAAALAGRPAAVAGSIDGQLAIARRGADRTIRYDLAANLAKPALAITARGALGPDRATASIDSAIARIEADLPLSRRALDLDRELSIDVDIPTTRLAEIAALLPPASADRLRSRATRGSIAARIALAGTAREPRGTIAIEADAELVKLAGRALEIDADLAIASDGGRLTIRPDASVSLASIAGELAEISGTIALGDHIADGRLDLGAAARAARLDLAVDLVERPASSLPKLARAGGMIGGRLGISGTPAAPRLSGSARWTGYATAAGIPGTARLAIDGTPEAIDATVGLGARDAREVAEIRAEIRRGDRVEIRARARADDIRLAGVVPAIAAVRELGVDLGTLDWNMDADLSLAGRELARADVRGHLEISGGSLAIPGSRRRVHDIDLRIEAGGDRVELTRLSARERDRSVAVTGALDLQSIKPESLALNLRARDWLVFGGSMGLADAPRAELDADVAVSVDMTRPIWAVDAVVRSLHFNQPDRFDRAHGLETISVNRDIMFLDEPGVEVGKLAPARPTARPVARQPRRRRPLDVRIRFARPARITRAPLDVRATGELAIAVRQSGVTTRGELELVDGDLSLFGHPHPLDRGRLFFDEAHPNGAMDLVFARELPPAVLRQVSRESAGTAITVTLAGPLSGRQITLGGPGAGGFLETLAWENAGRGMHHTAPGLPASASVQAPRGDQPLVLTFIQVNLPHMQLLERFSAWSDERYGRVEHFEGERYGRDNDTRLKVVARPETIGRSRAEVQLDRLWINRADLAVGAGVRAGSRAGGGVGVFLEWSSDD